MGYIHCCGSLHKTKTFKIVPENNYLECELDILHQCPKCGSNIFQLTRINNKNELSVIRKSNNKGKKFFERLKSKILYEIKIIDYKKFSHTNFYLNYNEFGIKKRCYSNFSSLKLGKFENL